MGARVGRAALKLYTAPLIGTDLRFWRWKVTLDVDPERAFGLDFARGYTEIDGSETLGPVCFGGELVPRADPGQRLGRVTKHRSLESCGCALRGAGALFQIAAIL